MDFQVKRGFFTADFLDCFAILGIPVDANVEEIQKQYRKIARRLHPDALLAKGKTEQEQGNRLFSKWVSPAYRTLSQPGEHTEFALLLKLKARQALKEIDSLALQSEAAKQLLDAGNFDATYKSSLQELTQHQYESLDQVLSITENISELNLVYLMRRENKGQAALKPSQPTQPAQTQAKPATTPTSPATGAPPQPPSPLAQSIRRAEEFMKRNNYAQAILELRDALQLDPTNSRCHGLLGMVYLKQNQLTMAKVHLNQALKLNPDNPQALEGKKELERQLSRLGKTDSSAAQTAKQSGKSEKRGGLFGLFGDRK